MRLFAQLPGEAFHVQFLERRKPLENSIKSTERYLRDRRACAFALGRGYDGKLCDEVQMVLKFIQSRGELFQGGSAFVGGDVVQAIPHGGGA